MKKFEDSSGWLRTTLCCVILMTQYTVRDTLLTALPTIASDRISLTPEDTNDTTTIAPIINTTESIIISIAEEKTDQRPFPLSILWQKLGQSRKEPVYSYQEFDSKIDGNEQEDYVILVEEDILIGENTAIVFKDGWDIKKEGAVLSSLYLGWFLIDPLSQLIVSKLGANLVLAITVGTGGLLGILTHATSLGGPFVMLPFRIILGATQGLCYSAVMKSLQKIPETSRMATGSIVALGPVLGTCVGVGLGSLGTWYIGTYLMGSLALPLIPLCLMLPSSNDENDSSLSKGSPLKSKGVWACLSVIVATTFTFHTVMTGLPMCLAYTSLDKASSSGVAVLSVVLVVILVGRIGLILASLLHGKGPLTVLNRRRLPAVIGCILIFAGLIVMATAGLDVYGALIGLAVAGAGLGIGLIRLSCRLNLEDMAPWKLPGLLSYAHTAGVFTAVWPPLLVGFTAQAGEDMWVATWLIPLALIIPSTIIFVFLLTTNSQPWGETPEIHATNGVVPTTDGNSPAARGVRMSFKSAKSGMSFKTARSEQTFKTAMSRRRSRTMSCRTVDEDLSVDMRSIAEDDEDLRSIEGSDVECKSVASSNTFKSDGADMHSIDLNAPSSSGAPAAPGMFAEGGAGTPSDRTSAWLSFHHQVSVEDQLPRPSPPTKDDMYQKNLIYDLFW